MQNNWYWQTVVEMVKRDGSTNLLFEPTLEEVDYYYSNGISIEKVKNSIYSVHYKLTVEK